MAEIGNRKERVRVREAGASAAGRGQRPYASFPGFLPLNPLRTPSPPLKRAGTPCTRERGVTTRTNRPAGASEGWVTGYGGLKQFLRNQVSLRSLILVFYRFTIWGTRELRWGCRPKPCLREIPPQTPFYASRRFKAAFTESGFASLPDSCFFIASRFGERVGYDGVAPHTLLGALPQTPARNFVPCTLSSLRGGVK